jgi:hypothetical protein
MKQTVSVILYYNISTMILKVKIEIFHISSTTKNVKAAHIIKHHQTVIPMLDMLTLGKGKIHKIDVSLLFKRSSFQNY